MSELSAVSAAAVLMGACTCYETVRDFWQAAGFTLLDAFGLNAGAAPGRWDGDYITTRNRIAVTKVRIWEASAQQWRAYTRKTV